MGESNYFPMEDPRGVVDIKYTDTLKTNFSEDLILALLARILRSLKLDITNKSFQRVGRTF
jgi:hypothetical protein